MSTERPIRRWVCVFALDAHAPGAACGPNSPSRQYHQNCGWFVPDRGGSDLDALVAECERLIDYYGEVSPECAAFATDLSAAVLARLAASPTRCPNCGVPEDDRIHRPDHLGRCVIEPALVTEILDENPATVHFATESPAPGAPGGRITVTRDTLDGGYVATDRKGTWGQGDTAEAALRSLLDGTATQDCARCGGFGEYHQVWCTVRTIEGDPAPPTAGEPPSEPRP